MEESAKSWAWSEFGAAKVPDLRLKKRLLRLAAEAVRHPAGRLTQTVRVWRELDGAYDFLEGGRVKAADVMLSCAQATALRCRGLPYVHVPIDGSSLSMRGPIRRETFGAIGSHKVGGRGIKVMTGLAVTPDGVPAGLCAQRWWMRQQRRRLSKCGTRPIEQKETRYWLEAIEDTRLLYRQWAPGTRPWFQLDSEGDNLAILDEAQGREYWVTTRARHNRRLRAPDQPLTRRNRTPKYLGIELRKQPCLGVVKLAVTDKQTRAVRHAQLELRASRFLFERTHPVTSAVLVPVPANAVHLVEVGAPADTKPLEMILLTTAPIDNFEQVERIVRGYSMRWRIEEFHLTWKSGTCNVEQTQLRNAEAVVLWATILSAVATRIERLKYLSRSEPDRLAVVEFDAAELEAIRLLKRRHDPRARLPPAAEMTIGQATRFVADIGGYVGRASRSPPGSATIARGLEWVRVAADIIRQQGAGSSPPSKRRFRT